MDDAMQALAQRAVKCKAWRWLPGMLVIDDTHHARLLHEVGGGMWAYGISANEAGCGRLPRGLLPDLEDPATVGCLLHIAREAWGDPGATTAWDGAGRWYIDAPFSEALFDAGVIAFTEAEALVAALEAAQ